MKLRSISASRQRQAVQLADEQRSVNRSLELAGPWRKRAAMSPEGLEQGPVTRETAEIRAYVEEHLVSKQTVTALRSTVQLAFESP